MEFEIGQFVRLNTPEQKDIHNTVVKIENKMGRDFFEIRFLKETRNFETSRTYTAGVKGLVPMSFNEEIE